MYVLVFPYTNVAEKHYKNIVAAAHIQQAVGNKRIGSGGGEWYNGEVRATLNCVSNSTALRGICEIGLFLLWTGEEATIWL